MSKVERRFLKRYILGHLTADDPEGQRRRAVWTCAFRFSTDEAYEITRDAYSKPARTHSVASVPSTVLA